MVLIKEKARRLIANIVFAFTHTMVIFANLKNLYMREIQFREALREAMNEEMRRNDRVFLMGEELIFSNNQFADDIVTIQKNSDDIKETKKIDNTKIDSVSKISKNLSEYSENNVNAKFNFEYRYLTAKCNEKRYNVSVKVSPLEKVIQNILGNSWAHLFEASWNQASVLQKIIVAVLLLATCFCYGVTIKHFIKSKK